MPEVSEQEGNEVGSPAPPESGKGGNPKRKRLLFGAGLVLAIVVFIVWWHGRNRESTDDAQIEAHIEQISPRVPGTVIEVDVLENQPVKAGQILFKLDPSDYQLALQRAEADLQAARARAAAAATGVPVTSRSSGSRLSGAQAGLRESRAAEDLTGHQVDAARAKLDAAEAGLHQAQAQAALARSNERRYAALAAKNEISRLQFDQVRTQAAEATAALGAARAEVNAARQAVASAQAQLQVSRDRVLQAAAHVRGAATAPQQVRISRSQARTAQAQVALAQAAVAQAKLNLEYTVVRAPNDGRVGNKHVEIGQALAPGQPALAIIPSNVWVIANYKETDLQQMRPGQKVQIHVDAYDQDFNGYVQSIGTATGAQFSLLPPENATGNFVKVVQRIPVKIFFDPNQDVGRLRAGMSVEATVLTAR